MRVLLVSLLLFAYAAEAAKSRSRNAAVVISGQEYVSLEKWAESNRFHFSSKDDEVKLMGRSARLLFKTKSQRAEINGINFFLAFPVATQGNAVYIARKDIDQSLEPILFPARKKPHELIKTIALSAGHGGKDPGFRLGTEAEKKYTLLLAKTLQELIKRAGMKAVLVRSSDRFIELEARPRLAKRAKADLFLELHYNSAGPDDRQTRGAEVYCLTPAAAISTNGGKERLPGPLIGDRHDERSTLLAYELHRSLVENGGLTDRGVRRAQFVVLRNADMPAVLIEAGFMSQPDEMRRIRNPVYRRQTAQAILDGLLAYKRAVERAGETSRAR